MMMRDLEVKQRVQSERNIALEEIIKELRIEVGSLKEQLVGGPVPINMESQLKIKLLSKKKKGPAVRIGSTMQ